MIRLQPVLRGLWQRRLRLLVSLAVTALIVTVLPRVAAQAVARNKPTASDHEVTMKMLAQARDPALFDGQGPGGPSIMGQPHPRRAELRIYSVVEPAAQDRVLVRLQGPRDRPVLVRFYQQPPQMQPIRGGGGFTAGPVTLLREVTLDQSPTTQPPTSGATAASPAT